MSSFKSDKHKRLKLKYIENIEINKKDGYIKADQLHYFSKSKTTYYVVGQVDGDVLIRILERIQYLDTKGKLKQNIENLKTKISC